MRAWVVAGVAGVCAYLGSMVAAVVALLGDPTPDQPQLIVPTTVFVVVAAVLGIRAAIDRRLNPDTRSAWRWIAASFVLLLASNVLFPIPWDFFPAPADLCRLAMVPVLVTGLLRMPMGRGGGRRRLTVALDAGTVVAAGGAFLWYLQIGPAMSAPGATPGRIIAGSLYPLGDLLLIFGIAVVLLRGHDAVRRPVQLLVAASVPWLLGDTILGYVQTHSRTNTVPGWVLLFFLTAHFGLAAAAYEQLRVSRTGGSGTHTRRSLRVSRLPYAAVGAGYALLFYVVVDQHVLFPWGGLVLCAFVLTTLVGVRQVIAQHENHRMAVTDALTGLANRVRLNDALVLALARAGRQGQTTAVLLADLNGFKQVNDTMGHAAGDQLLVAYAGMLRSAILGGDVAARLGGDEFAIVLHRIGSAEAAETVARRILQETETPVMIGDTPIRVRGSIGIALSGPGELDAEELLRRADHAMYEAKREKAGTWHTYTEPAPAAPVTPG